ncbi:MAG: hypothetical protein ACRDRJ_49200 [Streptosporangiaceae bacterium]
MAQGQFGLFPAVKERVLTRRALVQGCPRGRAEAIGKPQGSLELRRGLTMGA